MSRLTDRLKQFGHDRFGLDFSSPAVKHEEPNNLLMQAADVMESNKGISRRDFGILAGLTAGAGALFLGRPSTGYCQEIPDMVNLEGLVAEPTEGKLVVNAQENKAYMYMDNFMTANVAASYLSSEFSLGKVSDIKDLMTVVKKVDNGTQSIDETIYVASSCDVVMSRNLAWSDSEFVAGVNSARIQRTGTTLDFIKKGEYLEIDLSGFEDADIAKFYDVSKTKEGGVDVSTEAMNAYAESHFANTLKSIRDGYRSLRDKLTDDADIEIVDRYLGMGALETLSRSIPAEVAERMYQPLFEDSGAIATDVAQYEPEDGRLPMSVAEAIAAAEEPTLYLGVALVDKETKERRSVGLVDLQPENGNHYDIVLDITEDKLQQILSKYEGSNVAFNDTDAIMSEIEKEKLPERHIYPGSETRVSHVDNAYAILAVCQHDRQVNSQAMALFNELAAYARVIDTRGGYCATGRDMGSLLDYATGAHGKRFDLRGFGIAKVEPNKEVRQ